MHLDVTLLLDAGKPDPAWTLTDGQAQTFAQFLQTAPTVSDPGGALFARQRYGGFMVTSGGGDRFIVFRGWIRGGVVTQFDEDRAIERWLLETAPEDVDDAVRASIQKETAPKG